MKKDKVFEQHPDLKSYHKTSDGTKFYKAADAQNHARSLNDRTVEEIENPGPATAQVSVENAKTTPNKPEGTGDELNAFQKAKLRVEAIEKMETVEEINEALKDETAKTVLSAGAERIKALENPKAESKTGTEEEE